MRAPNITALRAFARKWQEMLRLSHWEIAVVWATKQDFLDGDCSDDCDGSCTWQLEHHFARVMINKRVCTDPHATIIHELLHIAHESHRERPLRYDAAYEHSLNVLADLLLQLSAGTSGPC